MQTTWTAEITDGLSVSHLEVDLVDMIGALEGRHLQLSWTAFELQMMGCTDPALNILEVEQRSQVEAGGMVLSGSELESLARRVRNTINGIFIGCGEEVPLPTIRRFPLPLAVYQAATVVFEADDGTRWTATSQDRALVESIASHFKEVTLQKTQL